MSDSRQVVLADMIEDVARVLQAACRTLSTALSRKRYIHAAGNNHQGSGVGPHVGQFAPEYPPKQTGRYQSAVFKWRDAGGGRHTKRLRDQAQAQCAEYRDADYTGRMGPNQRFPYGS